MKVRYGKCSTAGLCLWAGCDLRGWAMKGDGLASPIEVA